jgi:hypothetical protein
MKAVWFLLALVVIVVAGALFYIDRVLIESVERGGSHALGVDTELDSVRLGLLSGKLSLSGLRVANPEGFELPHFLSLDRGDVHVRLPSLMQDKIVVPSLTVSGLEMSLERSKGRANYGVILDNLAKLESEESQPASEEERAQGAESKGFVIRELEIRDVTARARLAVPGTKPQEYEVNIPEIKLEDVGSGSAAGVSLAGLARVITTAVLEAVVKSSRGDLAKGLARDLRGRLARVERVQIEVPSSVKDISGKDLGGAVEKGAELLKGLRLGGKKE